MRTNRNRWNTRGRHSFSGGRNGPDALSLALSLISCILLLTALFCGSTLRCILWIPALICLAISYFRIFSRNTTKRAMEDAKFRQLLSPLTLRVNRFKTKRRQKNLYCFFKCPSCATVLRVPKGKGRIRITCKNCSSTFERTT